MCLLASLAALQGEAKEAVLKRQIRNFKEYNRQKRVLVNSGNEVLFPGDLVWVRVANSRRNKLARVHEGPITFIACWENSSTPCGALFEQADFYLAECTRAAVSLSPCGQVQGAIAARPGAKDGDKDSGAAGCSG